MWLVLVTAVGSGLNEADGSGAYIRVFRIYRQPPDGEAAAHATHLVAATDVSWRVGRAFPNTLHQQHFIPPADRRLIYSVQRYYLHANLAARHVFAPLAGWDFVITHDQSRESIEFTNFHKRTISNAMEEK